MAQEIRQLPGRQGFEAAVRLLHAVHQVGGEGVPEGVQALLFDPRRLRDAVVPFPEIQRAGIPEPLCGLSIPLCFLFGVSMPSFWVGFLLMYLFGVKLKLLSVMGSGDFKHIILPSLALALWMASLYIRRVRGSMLEEMNKDYLNGGLAWACRSGGLFSGRSCPIRCSRSSA